VNVVDIIKTSDKPKDLTKLEKTPDIEKEIKKEEIKEYVKKLNSTRSNLKKYTVLYMKIAPKVCRQ